MMPDARSAKPKLPTARASAAQEEEIYGTLGSLLGTLEVIATDDELPLAVVQAERVLSALRLCQGMQHQLEGLLTLACEDLEQRLRPTRATLRPLIEHAIRGALRSFEQAGVELQLPTSADWGSERVEIDASRVDRMLRALTETLLRAVGRGGSIAVALATLDGRVTLSLRGQVGQRAGQPLAQAVLVARGASRLFALHGGSFTMSAEQLTLQVELPLAEAP